MKIVIMQPAFLPPASYLRLFAASDLFVILDNVQFNRRWYTHRQKLTALTGEKEWLTIPLAKQPRDITRISDIKWADDTNGKWKKQIRKFPDLGLDESLPVRQIKPVDFIVNSLQDDCSKLQIKWKVIYASALNIRSNFGGQYNIIAMCKEIGATEYINSPGGRSLYDEDIFSRNGINLTFLHDYKGNYQSIAERFANEDHKTIRQEIMDNL